MSMTFLLKIPIKEIATAEDITFWVAATQQSIAGRWVHKQKMPSTLTLVKPAYGVSNTTPFTLFLMEVRLNSG